MVHNKTSHPRVVFKKHQHEYISDQEIKNGMPRHVVTSNQCNAILVFL